MKYTKKEIGIFTIGAVAIGLLLLLNIVLFKNYQESQISLQKGHVMTTAKMVANSLNTYYEEALERFSLYFKDEVDQGRLTDYYEGQKELSGIYVVDKQGSVLFSLGQDHGDQMDQVIESYKGLGGLGEHLLPPILTARQHFTQFMVGVFAEEEGEVGYVVAAMEMDTIYKMLVEPIRIGKSGYSMVKQYDGTILMHKSKEQLGIDALEGRRERYSEYDLNLDDLEHWLAEQRENEEGARILDSYWWEDGKTPVKSQKIVAYTQVPIGEEVWIVNSTLDYNELREPLRLTQRYLFLLTAGVMMVFGLLLLLIVGNANKSHVMEQELKHLLEMNKAWEELHKREEQIRHNDKMNTLGTMTGMIAHEFNNFLTPIMLYGEMLIGDDSISEENKECLKEMVEAAIKSRELTGELSRYGRAEKGTGKKLPLQVSKELERSLKLLRKTLPAQITLEQNIEADGGFCLMAGAGMINQVIVNLCTNGIHAMGERGGVLTVKGVMMMDGDARRYGITIQDTGPGISPEALSQIFTPFYTTKEAGMGTGLGLSVVQDLIHQVSGDIHVISTLGQGTRFDILLPIAPVPHENVITKENQSLDGRSLYLLDDNEQALQAFEKVFKPICKKVKSSNHPEKALTDLRGSLQEWDVIVTDYSMPMMTGLEFAGILRSHGYNGKIILMSGCLNRDVEWYRDNGIIDGVLEKPVTRQDVEACMKS